MEGVECVFWCNFDFDLLLFRDDDFEESSVDLMRAGDVLPREVPDDTCGMDGFLFEESFRCKLLSAKFDNKLLRFILN